MGHECFFPFVRPEVSTEVREINMEYYGYVWLFMDGEEISVVDMLLL